MFKMLTKSIEESTTIIRENRGDATKKMLVDFNKETIKRDRKRLKLVQKPFTPHTLIDMLESFYA
jgi:hypothetical protein